MKKYAVISMDVEDWYHTYFPEQSVDRSVSMLDGLDVALDILNAKDIKASFFVVGETIEKLSQKLRQMDKDGHEIACHGLNHKRALSTEKEEYRSQLIESKAMLERILGHPVYGYRAPSFAIDDEYLQIVRDCGFSYDSSKLQPQKSAKYGALELRSFKEIESCIYQDDGFFEFEVSTQKIGNLNMLLGGGYIRMLPWVLMKQMHIRYLSSGKIYVMYIHPIDLSNRSIPKVPDMSLDHLLRTHVGRRHMRSKFQKTIALLEQYGYEFTTFSEIYLNMLKRGET